MNSEQTRNEQTRKLLETTAECGIPLQHAVALLFRARRMSLGAFAKRAGYQRTYLYQTLAGKLVPSPQLRTAMAGFLGVDPWEVYGLPSDTAGPLADDPVTLNPRLALIAGRTP